MNLKRKLGSRQPIPHLPLLLFLLVVFLLGGGSRQDIVSLVVLRPIAAGMLVYGLAQLRWETVRELRYLFAFAAACLALAAVHIIPLPPAIWTNLPGRDLLASADAAAGLSGVWRPIAMVPSGAWNALFSLTVPLAILVLVSALPFAANVRLAKLLIGIGIFSVLLGVLQVAGPRDGPLYFYRVTNNGNAVGLFSNRNHHAIFIACLFPMLAMIASAPVRDLTGLKVRFTVLAAVGLFLAAAGVLIGSRIGLLAVFIGCAGALLTIRFPTIRLRTHRSRPIGSPQGFKHFRLAALVVLGVSSLAVLFLSGAPVADRVLTSDSADELRFQVLGPIAAMAWKYFPIGSGLGSFVEVYQIDEPTRLLRSTYLNHAHNDWLEIVLTAGLPGLLLAGLAGYGVIRATLPLLARSANFDERRELGSAGALILVILAVGSLGDYPLRTPSLSALCVLASVWLARSLRTARQGTIE